jgi:hypothetical protein
MVTAFRWRMICWVPERYLSRTVQRCHRSLLDVPPILGYSRPPFPSSLVAQRTTILIFYHQAVVVEHRPHHSSRVNGPRNANLENEGDVVSSKFIAPIRDQYTLHKQNARLGSEQEINTRFSTLPQKIALPKVSVKMSVNST